MILVWGWGYHGLLWWWCTCCQSLVKHKIISQKSLFTSPFFLIFKFSSIFNSSVRSFQFKSARRIRLGGKSCAKTFIPFRFVFYSAHLNSHTKGYISHEFENSPLVGDEGLLRRGLLLLALPSGLADLGISCLNPMVRLSVEWMEASLNSVSFLAPST